jgi:prepilin-type N-terminal cleavage/methylation domain-containing protein
MPGGFSLVELVVVIAIMGILAWVAYPRFAAVYEIKLGAASRRVAADLRYAQGRSIGDRQVHGILFEPSSARYTVFAPTAASPVTDPADRGRPLRVDFTARTEYQGVSIASASFGRTHGVTFDYFGVPRDTAGVELSSPGRIVLRYQDTSDTIEVSPGTGKVTIR